MVFRDIRKVLVMSLCGACLLFPPPSGAFARSGVIPQQKVVAFYRWYMRVREKAVRTLNMIYLEEAIIFSIPRIMMFTGPRT
ncbi:hypothetical protein JCM25156A_26010 [Komagataeibacter kakiaceti JCM 25156]